MCLCGMPGVEIDYPQVGLVGWEANFYAFKYCCEPRHIGDTESQEYKDHAASFTKYEEGIAESLAQYGITGDTKITPKPPNPENFGVTPEEEWRSHSFNYPKPVPPLLRCPFCSSTDLTKISSFGKAIKIWAFGLYGMDDTGKTYKCNNCGGKF